jgi:hypothetical protein
LRPNPENESFDQVGGAVAGCFLNATSAEEAQRWAYEHFRETHWDIVTVEEPPRLVDRSEYEADTDNLEWFDQAHAEGECYVLYQWPLGVQDGDVIH